MRDALLERFGNHEAGLLHGCVHHRLAGHAEAGFLENDVEELGEALKNQRLETVVPTTVDD